MLTFLWLKLGKNNPASNPGTLLSYVSQLASAASFTIYNTVSTMKV